MVVQGADCVRQPPLCATVLLLRLSITTNVGSIQIHLAVTRGGLCKAAASWCESFVMIGLI